jgi:hypothetical protein
MSQIWAERRLHGNCLGQDASTPCGVPAEIRRLVVRFHLVSLQVGSASSPDLVACSTTTNAETQRGCLVDQHPGQFITQ